MKKKSKQKRSSNRISSILETAKSILDSEGLKNFNTNYIAKKSGISIGSLYQYFQSKELILAELMTREYNKQLNNMEQLFANVRTLKLEEKLKAVIEASFAANHLNDYLQKGESFFKLKQAVSKRDSFEKEFFEKSKRFLLESSQKLSPEKIEQALLVISTSIRNSSKENTELKEALINLGLNFLTPKTS